MFWRSGRRSHMGANDRFPPTRTCVVISNIFPHLPTNHRADTRHRRPAVMVNVGSTGCATLAGRRLTDSLHRESDTLESRSLPTFGNEHECLAAKDSMDDFCVCIVIDDARVRSRDIRSNTLFRELWIRAAYTNRLRQIRLDRPSTIMATWCFTRSWIAEAADWLFGAAASRKRLLQATAYRHIATVCSPSARR